MSKDLMIQIFNCWVESHYLILFESFRQIGTASVGVGIREFGFDDSDI